MLKRSLYYVAWVMGFLLIGTLIVFALKPKSPTGILGSSPAASPTPVGRFELNFQEKSLTLVWFEAKDLDSLKLVPNFTARLTAKEAREEYGCQSIINGGFYTEDYKPVGLFVYDNNTLSAFQTNNLFNGILSVNDFATPRITRGMPLDNPRLALQTGPLLFENATAQKLSLVRDETARRMVALTTGENKLYFLAIYSSKAAFDGPRLADLPELLGIFQDRSGIKVADAVNLDGGTASAFINNETILSEASTVGSFLCAQ